MINLILRNRLPFTQITITHNGNVICISNVLIDTGSMSTIISTETASMLGLKPELDDKLHTICGVGGAEYVYQKLVESIELDKSIISSIKIQVGAMDYGFEINAIIGMDYLRASGAVIDTDNMTLSCSKRG